MDPLFVDSDNGDWHLQSGSQCINQGATWSRYDHDASRADIGAFTTDNYAGTADLPVGSIGGTVSGVINTDMIIADDVIVEEGQSLTISAGVTFHGVAGIKVYGTLIAEGTVSDSIKFIGQENGWWSGIDFYNADGQLSYCLIKKSSSNGIFCYSSSPLIEYSSLNTDIFNPNQSVNY